MKTPRTLILAILALVSCNKSNDIWTKARPYQVIAESKLSNEKSIAEAGIANYPAQAVSAKISTKKIGKIILKTDETLAREEYILKVTPHVVRITGGSSAGVFYGIQTMLQEMNAYNGQLLCGTIKDAPRYAWRGYMLDESRMYSRMLSLCSLTSICTLVETRCSLATRHGQMTSISSLSCRKRTWKRLKKQKRTSSTELLHMWRHNRPDHLYDGIKDGYEMVLCPRRPMYFDHRNVAHHAEPMI